MKIKKAIVAVILHALQVKHIRILCDGTDVTKKVLEKEVNKLLKENILNSAEIVQYLRNKYIVLNSISIYIDRRIIKKIIEQRQNKDIY